MPRIVQILQGSFPAGCLAEGELSQPHQGGDESSLGTPWCPCASAGGHNECPWSSIRDGNSVRGKLMGSQQPGEPRDTRVLDAGVHCLRLGAAYLYTQAGV